MPLLFEDAAKTKDAIMVSQQKEIQMLYLDWAEDIADKAYYYAMKSNASAAISERYYKELYNQMKETNKQLGKEIQGIITGNMYTIADSVVASNVEWLKTFGFSAEGLNAAFSYIPNDVVQRLITGQIYQGGWNLSQRIWSDSQQTQKDIYQIMARGLAEQKPIYEIAKDLESYVRPGASKKWNPVLAMRNTKTGEIEYKRLYKNNVDYNAQRLARTLAQHSYQQSFIAATQNNPFITEYIWHSNGSRVCELCLTRDGKHFKKNELPMDHPNGMCTMEPVVVDDMVDQLADWFNSPDGTYPEIDEFAGNFGYQAKAVKTPADFVNKYGMSTKSPNAWFNSLTSTQKAEAKMLKEQSGLSWNDWYEKHVHSTGDATQDFVKKYGTSTKSPNAWFNSLTPSQKAEAKLLKEQSGLTWNDWYNKNVYAGNNPVTAGKTTGKMVQAFSDAQEKYLSPYGFSIDNMPKNFDDWSHKISYSQASEILQSMGTSWSDPHPYQQLMKYYNANLTNSSFVSKAAAATTKVTTSTAAATTSKVVNAVDDAFDAAKWYNSVRANDVDMMRSWTDDWLSHITTTERNAVRTYTGSAYSNMNNYLRGLTGSTNYANDIKNCQAALAKASLPQETIVRRGSYYNMLDELGLGSVTPQNVDKFIGGVVMDKGFVSTSPAADGGFSGSIEYVIKLPQGSQAAYVAPISKFSSEQELLINCGGKFKVEGVEFDSYGGVSKIFMTLINLQ